MEGESNFRPWNELIPNALGLIFSNLEAREILKVIPLVCKSWCKVVEEPYCWKRIVIDDLNLDVDKLHAEMMVERLLRRLIPRSSGSLTELCVSFIHDDMLSFIAEHAGSLQTLKLRNSRISDSAFEQIATKLASLTTLVVYNCRGMNLDSLDAIRRNCKRLVSLCWGYHPVLQLQKQSNHEDDSFTHTMPNLKHLSLSHYLINDSYILSLLSSCPKLESLEIRGGWFIKLEARALKEKYPNIVTVVLSNKPVSNSDH